MVCVVRVISEKKRLETSSGGQGTKIRDIETEELIEDQQQKIRCSAPAFERESVMRFSTLFWHKRFNLGPI